MKHRHYPFICAGAVFVASLLSTIPTRGQALPETVESIDKARVTTRILFITAHPDDEASSLLSYLSHGLHADVALLTITRGQGGQNAIGPEQGARLGILRTSELLAASRNNGVTQFFTRAADFGYSKSADQTMKIWGDLALEDMVRVIRTFRPDVVINGWGGVHWGHGQHQASGILTPRAVTAAADASKFPAQIGEGLKPWKTSLLLEDRRADGSPGYHVPLDDVSPLWGKSYNDFGRDSLVFHRSQGVTMFLGSPYLRRPLYLVAENSGTDSSAKVGPDELARKLAMLAPQGTPAQEALARADKQIAQAHDAALRLDWPAAAAALASAGKEVAQVENSRANWSDDGLKWELGLVRGRIDRALAGAAALRVDARADRNVVVAGESCGVKVSWRLRQNVGVSVKGAALAKPETWTATRDRLEKDSESQDQGAKFTVSVPANATAPLSAADAILPWPPPLLTARVEASISGYSFVTEQPVISVHPTSTSVDTFPLQLIPAVTLTIEPKQIIVPESRAGQTIELLARVRYHGTRAAKVTLGAEVPQGWNSKPLEALDFSGAGDQIVRYEISPPAQAEAGAYSLKPFAQIGTEEFRTSVEPLPSLPTRNWSEPAEAAVHVLDLNVPQNLRVGYVTVESDPLPDQIRQLGIRVDRVDELELAFGDLSRYDAIVVGIRAYELRADLARANGRLLGYARQGGTLLVQYQRDFAWEEVLPAPFPATMPDDDARTTDANSPVHFLAPDSPLLNFPNKITQDDFQGWVQERGLYYWGTFDSRYQAVLGLTDPGEKEEHGALVTARVGKGTYIYTGLSFFRELPAGVPGAYRLFVNLLSQSKTNPSSTAQN